MEELRTPCAHRGTADVVTSVVDADLRICICGKCRRFWLERNGWLLSRREAAAVLRAWPFEHHRERVAR